MSQSEHQNIYQGDIRIILSDQVRTCSQHYPDWTDDYKLTTLQNVSLNEVLEDIINELRTIEFTGDMTISGGMIDAHRRNIVEMITWLRNIVVCNQSVYRTINRGHTVVRFGLTVNKEGN